MPGDDFRVLKAIDDLKVDMKGSITGVHARIDVLGEKFDRAKEDTIDRLARLEEKESNCPIKEVAETVHELEVEAGSANTRSLRALLTAVGSGIAAAIAAAMGLKGGSG